MLRTGEQVIAKRQFRIALALFSFAAGGMAGGAIGVAWLSIRDTWSLPTSFLGVLLLAMTSGFLTGCFISGHVVTRLGMGNTLFYSSAVTILGLLLFGLAPGWTPLIVIVIFSGLGKGIFGASLNLYFANHFNARLMNWLHAGFAMGAMLGPFIVQWTVSSGYGWRFTWLVFAMIQLFVSAAFLFTRGDWTTVQEQQGPAAEAVPTIRETLRAPAVLQAMILFFIFTGIESAAGNWSFTLFSESRGTDPAAAASWVGLYWGSFAMGRFLYGFIADRLRQDPGIRILLLLIVMGGLMFSLREHVIVSVAGLMLVGLAQAPVTPLLFSTTPVRLGAGHATNAIGFQMSATGLGFSVLPALVGVVAGVSTLEILGPFLALSALLSLLLFNRISRAGIPQPA